MSSEPRTMSELREHPVEKAIGDGAFRARLPSDPKAVIEEEPGPTAAAADVAAPGCLDRE